MDSCIAIRGCHFPLEQDLDDYGLARRFRIGQRQVLGELWEVSMEAVD